MERSLTVLLPVHNAQTTLGANVHQILEVLSDLSQEFEVVIVDDGSADATSEVAAELASRFPQVRAVRHGRRQGHQAAVRTGVAHSRGELIVVEQGGAACALAEIGRQWRRDAARLAHSLPVPPPTSAERRPAPQRFPAGFTVVPRDGLDPPAGRRPSRPNFLARLREFALGE